MARCLPFKSCLPDQPIRGQILRQPSPPASRKRESSGITSNGHVTRCLLYGGQGKATSDTLGQGLRTENWKLKAESWKLTAEGHTRLWQRQDPSCRLRAELLHLCPDSSVASSFGPKQVRARAKRWWIWPENGQAPPLLPLLTTRLSSGWASRFLEAEIRRRDSLVFWLIFSHLAGSWAHLSGSHKVLQTLA